MATRTVYIVQRVHWEYNDGWHYPGDETPLKAFADPRMAEDYRLILEQEARDAQLDEKWWQGNDSFSWWSENLFITFGTLTEISTLFESDILAGLRASGFSEPPPYNPVPGERSDPASSYEWWDGGWWSSLWDEARKQNRTQTVWDLFDKIRFFEIAAVEVE